MTTTSLSEKEMKELGITKKVINTIEVEMVKYEQDGIGSWMRPQFKCCVCEKSEEGNGDPYSLRLSRNHLISKDGKVYCSYCYRIRTRTEEAKW